MTDEAREFWDGVHRGRDSHGHRRHHPYLAEALTGGSAGRALELGCGDGANAVWLAQQGWTVTAVDLSQVALERAADHAERAGVAARISFQQADLEAWTTAEHYDLVSAFFVHTPFAMDYPAVLARATGWVDAGGELLVVGHYTLPPWAWDPQNTEGLPSAGELVAALALEEPAWRVRRAEEVPRTVTGRDGQEATVLDAVLHAVRS